MMVGVEGADELSPVHLLLLLELPPDPGHQENHHLHLRPRHLLLPASHPSSLQSRPLLTGDGWGNLLHLHTCTECPVQCCTVHHRTVQDTLGMEDRQGGGRQLG